MISIPSEYPYTDLDGAERIQEFRVSEGGYVTPLTAASMQVLPLEQLRKERDRLAGFAETTADWVRLSHLNQQIEQREAGTAALEAELADAQAAYAAVLEALTPYTTEIEYGDGWMSRSKQARHDQLLRKLADAQARMWAAQDALKTASAAA